MPGTGALILAAGGSSRLGRPKQSLPFRGRTLLRHAAESALSACCEPVVVVLGSSAGALQRDLADLPVSVAINPLWENGMGTSIRSGMKMMIDRASPPECVLIMLCDQPLVSADTLRRILRVYTLGNKPITVSTYLSTFGPPVVVSSVFFAELLQLPDASGAKSLWSARPDSVQLFPCLEAATDIDTQEHYDHLLTL
jgi:molybdenum cofactor cytidylyltransferase